MSDEFIDTLRCPIDPTRATGLVREQQSLVCRQCLVRFPVKLGIPVLLADEAQFPDDASAILSLPCQRATRRSRRTTG
jgi:uncharacterized protein YbaR (Trm112 family)